jgi:hypothetical protein
VLIGGKTLVTVVSAYRFSEQPLSATQSGWIYADASVHRVLSDVAAFIGTQRGHSLIVAGDFNILHGYGQDGSAYWKARYDSVFSRAAAMGSRSWVPSIGRVDKRTRGPTSSLPTA